MYTLIVDDDDNIHIKKLFIVYTTTRLIKTTSAQHTTHSSRPGKRDKRSKIKTKQKEKHRHNVVLFSVPSYIAYGMALLL